MIKWGEGSPGSFQKKGLLQTNEEESTMMGKKGTGEQRASQKRSRQEKAKQTGLGAGGRAGMVP